MTPRDEPLRDARVVVDREPQLPSLVKSAARVLQIFDFFDEVQREAKVQEIADQLEFPQSSTSVLLRSLVEMGFLDHDPQARTFLPSPRVALLGHWLGQGPMRDGTIVRMLEEIAAATGESVVLATRNGLYAQDVRVIQGRGAQPVALPQGLRRLVVWSATGLALLRDEPDDLVQALCRRANAEAEDGAAVDPRAVAAHLGQLRREGYVFSRGLVTPGLGSIAMPLPAGLDRGARLFAIAVTGRLAAIAARERELVSAMRRAIARHLSAPALLTNHMDDGGA
jgi:DNA-binding IclR family transcriptional regulator